MPTPPPLQDLVNRAIQRRQLSMAALANLASDSGRPITASTLRRIRDGTYLSEPRPETLRALAWLAEVSDDDAYRAAGLRAPTAPLAEPETLADLVQRATDLRQTSLYAQAILARENGYDVGYTTLTMIRSGKYAARPNADTLRALAWLAQVPPEAAFDMFDEPRRVRPDHQPETLAEVVERAVARRNMSLADMAVLANQNGHQISTSPLGLIRTGRYYRHPRVPMLRALAWLAELPEAQVFALVGQPEPGPPLADDLPPGADYLSPASRQAVIALVRRLVAQERAEDDADDRPGDGHE